MRQRLVLLSATVLFACGGGDSDDNGNGGNDGGADAANGQIDAAPDGSSSSSPLGQSCPNPECSSDRECVRQVLNGPGYCSIDCAANDVLVPPTEGDPMCAAIFEGNIGTPVCGMPTSNPAGSPQFLWYCVIDCSADDQCPANLTCQDYDGGGPVTIGRYCLR